MNLMRLILCVLIVLTMVGTVTAQDDENLLQNGGFEGTYIAIGGDPSLQVAPNWQPWSLPPPADATSSADNLRPDYQPAPDTRVRSGSAAQEYNTFFATHDGGVLQRVPISTGAELEFSAFVYVWSSATFENPDESIEPQGVMVQVGIDPTGGQSGDSDAIIWSDAQEFYDEYREVSVSATAQANAVTVFVRSAPEGAIGVNNIYVDDASLIQTGEADLPEPTEEPVEDDDAATDEDDDAATDEDDDAATDEDDDATTDEDDAATDEEDDAATDEEDDAATDEEDDAATDEDDDAATDEDDDAATDEDTVTIPGFPNRLTHTVQAGDTVLSIANQYGSTVEAISDANGLDNVGFIIVGQQLVVPTPAGVGEPVPGDNTDADEDDDDSTDETPTNTGTHVVQAGENLYRIALQYNTTVEALAALNNITNPNLLSAGTILQVPVTGANNTTGSTGGPTGSTPSTGNVTGGVHTVAAGQNVFRIGLLYNVTVERLALTNGLINPNLIFVGQQLVIPQ